MLVDAEGLDESDDVGLRRDLLLDVDLFSLRGTRLGDGYNLDRISDAGLGVHGKEDSAKPTGTKDGNEAVVVEDLAVELGEHGSGRVRRHVRLVGRRC